MYCMTGTAERCLLTARLFGDESELAFWTVALHYIRAARYVCDAIAPASPVWRWWTIGTEIFEAGMVTGKFCPSYVQICSF